MTRKRICPHLKIGYGVGIVLLHPRVFGFGESHQIALTSIHRGIGHRPKPPAEQRRAATVVQDPWVGIRSPGKLKTALSSSAGSRGLDP